MPPAKPASWGIMGSSAGMDAATYFIDLFNYALASGDTSEWRALTDPACEFCTRLADHIEGAYADGGHIEGGQVSVSKATLVVSDHGIYEIQHTYSQAAARLLNADGTERSTTDANSGYVIFAVISTGPVADPGWRLTYTRSFDHPLPEVAGDTP